MKIDILWVMHAPHLQHQLSLIHQDVWTDEDESLGLVLGSHRLQIVR